MGERILEWLHKIVTGPKSRVFWAIVILAVIIIVIIFPYVDANYLYYSRIEKRIDNLQDLVELSGSSIEDDEALNAEYQSILKELETAREKALTSAITKEDTVDERRVKFFTGAALLYLVALLVLFSKKKTEKWSFKRVANNVGSMVICFVLGTLIGWVFTLIPTLGSIEIHCVLTLILEVTVICLLFAKPSKDTTAS